MLKKILNIENTKKLNKKEQQSIHGGGFPFFGDCCACVFTPRGRSFPILITQSCSIPCPIDGSLEYEDTGC
ncbi:hypothetical protein [Aquimarina spongiae]|uniref:Uncharacterized protein n=1 Tax=Aquimarina spongiae TaxID=570521 RepID=A0A1M6F6Q3_9FLAO|nr:hypothetical protein [Aquimarina spongiae]SHI93269.1 hypothetical protein SAMN04488508_104116 [Aquimarina spongiae]